MVKISWSLFAFGLFACTKELTAQSHSYGGGNTGVGTSGGGINQGNIVNMGGYIIGNGGNIVNNGGAEGGGTFVGGGDGSGGRGPLELSIPGVPGQDYPVLTTVPNTGFTCNGRMPGYYADAAGDAGCQVFHVCDQNNRMYSFICPNGTIFNQKYFVCDWWYNFQCSMAEQFYGLNALLGQETGSIPGNTGGSGNTGGNIGNTGGNIGNVGGYGGGNIGGSNVIGDIRNVMNIGGFVTNPTKVANNVGGAIFFGGSSRTNDESTNNFSNNKFINNVRNNNNNNGRGRGNIINGNAIGSIPSTGTSIKSSHNFGSKNRGNSNSGTVVTSGGSTKFKSNDGNTIRNIPILGTGNSIRRGKNSFGNASGNSNNVNVKGTDVNSSGSFVGSISNIVGNAKSNDNRKNNLGTSFSSGEFNTGNNDHLISNGKGDNKNIIVTGSSSSIGISNGNTNIFGGDINKLNLPNTNVIGSSTITDNSAGNQKTFGGNSIGNNMSGQIIQATPNPGNIVSSSINFGGHVKSNSNTRNIVGTTTNAGNVAGSNSVGNVIIGTNTGTVKPPNVSSFVGTSNNNAGVSFNQGIITGIPNLVVMKANVVNGAKTAGTTSNSGGNNGGAGNTGTIVGGSSDSRGNILNPAILVGNFGNIISPDSGTVNNKDPVSISRSSGGSTTSIQKIPLRNFIGSSEWTPILP